MKRAPFALRWQRDIVEHALLPFGYRVLLQHTTNASVSFTADVGSALSWRSPTKPSGNYRWQVVPYGAQNVSASNCPEGTFSVAADAPVQVPYTAPVRWLLVSAAVADSPQYTVDSPMGWSHSGNYDGTASSWRLTASAGPTFGANASSIVWQCGGASGYAAGEYSYLESPLVDLRAVTLPQVRLSVRLNTRAGLDGAQLQMSSDGGATWRTLGADSGLYDLVGISAFVGVSTPAAFVNAGWSGSRAQWRHVALNVSSASCVATALFRLVFAADATPLTQTLDGVQINNFEVGRACLCVCVDGTGPCRLWICCLAARVCNQRAHRPRRRRLFRRPNCRQSRP